MNGRPPRLTLPTETGGSVEAMVSPSSFTEPSPNMFQFTVVESYWWANILG